MSDEERDDELVPEDWPTYYTRVPVWILLAGASAQAYRLYAFLAEHINNSRPGQRISCPKQTAIALVLGLKNPKQVARYANELAAMGAIRIAEYRYAGGMRRGYKYHVRFNPPAGYTGLVSLSQFYEAHPEVRSAANQGRVSAALDKMAGHAGGTPESTSGGTADSTARGATKDTVHGARNRSPKRDQGDVNQEGRDRAPQAARSASGRRQASTGSSAREAAGGSAASGNDQRLTPQQGKHVHAFLRTLPDYLSRHIPEKRPRNLSLAILAALAVGEPHERTPEQLLQYRVLAKWDKHYGALFGRGEIKSEVGAIIKMLERSAECGDPRCDERINVDTGQPCGSCGERVADEKQDRKAAAAAKVAEEHGTGDVDFYPEMPDPGSGEPPEWAPLPEQREDEPRWEIPAQPIVQVGCGAQPNDEYQRQREAARARKVAVG